MTRRRRVRAEIGVAWRAFLRRRTAVFFTFFFPLVLVLIFGALVRTGAGTGGLFTEPPGYYVAGYVTVVVLFTPLTRVGSIVARYRDGNRFEKLATTPLTRAEWMLAHVAVTAAVVTLAAALIVALVVVVTEAAIRLTPVVFVFPAVAGVLFSGIGAILGRLSSSRDGVVAASNTIALPLLFLSETFVPPSLLPAWFRPLVALSPATYFARALRAVTYGTGEWVRPAAILVALALVAFALGARAIPQTE
ncbi:MAG: ABC transporter permease [Halobacteriaceae archaeon]